MCFLKLCSDENFFMSAGNEFHSQGPSTMADLPLRDEENLVFGITNNN